MQKSVPLVLVLMIGIALLGSTLYPSHQLDTNSKVEVEISNRILNQIKEFGQFVDTCFLIHAQADSFDRRRVQSDFLEARILYKKFEWAAEYFAGDLAKRLNGPPVGEIENADLLDSSMVNEISPSGLQVIEEILYADVKKTDQKELIKEIHLLTKNTGFLISFFTNLPLTRWRITDAAKLEVFRVMTLGITGFDNPLTLLSMEESAVALEALKPVLRGYSEEKSNNQLLSDINDAAIYLRSHKDFNSFNRAKFIKEYANKITKGISSIQNYPVKYNRLLRQESQTLFDSNAFNYDAFVPGLKYKTTPERVVLGKKLFFDASLSGTGTRSCASCHLPDKGFADGLTVNTHINDKDKLLERNTPTLLNAGLQANQFYDMRALTLEDQAYDVIHNSGEMGGSLAQIVNKLRENEEYQQLFAMAYSNTESTHSIDTFEVLNALSAYIRGDLTKLNSRFDQYMQGDKQALTSRELNGFNLFMGKAKCATCHFMPLFNGMTPPGFMESEAEVIGTPASARDSVLSPDKGYYGIVGVESVKNAFKTPSVRNVNRTAPYMHNGAFQTLDDVMEFYNNGGPAGLGYKVENQTLPMEKLNLSSDEQKDIILFMKSLDSR